MAIKDGVLSSLLMNSHRSQNYDVEAHNYVNDPDRLSNLDGQKTTFSLRRDSLSLSNVLSTLLRKQSAKGCSLRGGSCSKGGDHQLLSEEQGSSLRRPPYFEIELMEDKRRRKSLDGYNRRLSISEYAKMFPELLSESSESISETPKKLIKTHSMNGGSCFYSESCGGSTISYRNRKKVQRSISSVSELIAPLMPKSDDIVSTRPEGASINSSTSLKTTNTETLPPSCSPGLSRTQELEDYAKQYENYYSKRILSNRSSRVNSMYGSENGDSIVVERGLKTQQQQQQPQQHLQYSSMSLPRKLPPESRRGIFKLREVEREEDEMNVTGGRVLYGTLPKKNKSNMDLRDENHSSHFSTLRKVPRKSSRRDSNYVIVEKDETPLGEKEEDKLLQKYRKKCVTASLENAQSLSPCDMNASELESWRRRQEAERYRILNLGEDLTPPKLPPKKPHLRSKGTFLLETDFDEPPTVVSNNVASSSYKKAPAPSPQITPVSSSSDWDLHSTSSPDNDLPQRTYHRDSFMAHRRDYVEQDGLNESSHNKDGQMGGCKEKCKSKDEQVIFCQAEQLQQTTVDANPHPSEQNSSISYSEKELNKCSTGDLELSNLSLYSGSQQQQPSSKSMRFTSDALKGIRTQKTGGGHISKLSPPPPVAPKPYNRSLSEKASKDANINHVTNSQGLVLSHISAPVLLARKLSHHLHNSENKRSNKLLNSEMSSLDKWKRSMDSLDTTNSSILSSNSANSHVLRCIRSNLPPPPPPSEIRTTKSGTLAPSSPGNLMLEGFTDKSMSNNRTSTLDAQNQITPPKHCHSNSDSGLSSLGGRTSTMSPVSTISSVSSGSSVSSRTSLRSASIVSSSTLPGEGVNNLIEEERGEESSINTIDTRSSPPHHHDVFIPKLGGTTYLNKRQRFQVEIDCEKMFQVFVRALETSSSSEILQKNTSIHNLHSLFFTSPNQRSLIDYVDGILEIVDEEKNYFHSLDESKIKMEESLTEHNTKDIKNNSDRSNILSSNAKSNGSLYTSPSLSSLFPSNNSEKDDVELVKAELLKRVDQKLNALRAAQLSLKEEMNLNEELGKKIAEEVKGLVSPLEYDKFDLHIQEMDKISNLLLGLSGRLARVENNLLALSSDPESKRRSDKMFRIPSETEKCLLVKKEKLVDQLMEAKETQTKYRSAIKHGL
ncbi:SHROOM [Lepeophtheirus salmonis]|uniref:SHROOM n=1 Tax=Lepeophtheirus salmonis TaxID=72036 RepID=A0A7R8H8X8_LEPSM|nr:SHROOM [Lepeophtheirus salmonis]CAF2939122.1 SHROOM [Lepeophtheirus salmonis]